MFNVTIQPDSNDPAPFLLSITPPVTTVNTPVAFQLPCFDVHMDPVTFYGPAELAQFNQFGIHPTQSINPNLMFAVNPSTGLVVVTPTNGLVGVQPMFFGVAEAPNSPISALPDTQMVPLFIDPAAPTSIAVLPESDTGVSDHDGITSLNNADSAHVLKFSVTGVTPGDTVVLFDRVQQIGSAVAQSSTVVVTTDGLHVLNDGLHAITAKQILKNQSYVVGNSSGTVDLASPPTPPLSVSVETVAPTVSIPSLGPNPLSSPVDSMNILFSKIVSGFNLAALALTCNGGGNLLGPDQSLSTSDDKTFTLNNLAALTATFGTYVVTLNANGSTITDIAGNPLAAGASVSFVVGSSLQVTNTLDSGAGSFRQALADAGASPGTPTIEFALPAGSQAISLLTPLPAVATALTIRLDATQSVTVALAPFSAWSNNSSLTVAGSGTLSLNGSIEGTGSLAVNAGSNLTSNHIVQNALVIGGTAVSPATMTIAASDASGAPFTALAAVAASDAEQDLFELAQGGAKAGVNAAQIESGPPVADSETNLTNRMSAFVTPQLSKPASSNGTLVAYGVEFGPATIINVSILPASVHEATPPKSWASDSVHRDGPESFAVGARVGSEPFSLLPTPGRAGICRPAARQSCESEAAIDTILADGQFRNALDEPLARRLAASPWE